MADEELLRFAEDYLLRFGWSVVPLRIRSMGKKPTVKWKQFQTRRPTLSELRRMFHREGVNGVAIVFGQVSGHLGSRDYDSMFEYQKWADDHPELANSLPTVETPRGRHIYFQTDPAQISELRHQIGRPNGTGALKVEDGELRIGVGCYCAAPPSKRPDGEGWSWLREPTREMPLVDVIRDGLLSHVDLFVLQQRYKCHEGDREGENEEGIIDHKVRAEDENRQQKNEVESKLHNQFDKQITQLIIDTQPCRVGQRNDLIFELCRALKGNPEWADAPVQELKPLVKMWWQMALPVIGTKPFSETWADFVHGWKSVRFPKGTEVMSQMLMLAQRSECPPEAIQYDSDKFRLLVSLCRELQRACGPNPFFLSVRTAGNLLDVDPSTASQWLGCLEADGIIQCVIKGNQSTRQASRFRYLPSL